MENYSLDEYILFVNGNFEENLSDYVDNSEFETEDLERSIYPVINAVEGKTIYEYHLPNIINEEIIDNLFETSIEDDEFLEYMFSVKENDWETEIYLQTEERVKLEKSYNQKLNILKFIFSEVDEDEIGSLYQDERYKEFQKYFEEQNKTINNQPLTNNQNTISYPTYPEKRKRKFKIEWGCREVFIASIIIIPIILFLFIVFPKITLGTIFGIILLSGLRDKIKKDPINTQ